MKSSIMQHAPKRFIVLATGLFLLLFGTAHAGLVVNAGPAQTTCKGDSVTLGGTPTASGGVGPYYYTWTPAAGMNNPSDANPHVKINATTMFYLQVVDSTTGNRGFDSVRISISPLYSASAGNDTSICPLTAGAILGGSQNSAAYAYSWTPLASGLSCYNCAHPTATPTSTTNYTLTITSGTCTDSSFVTVTVLATPVITVTPSVVTINEGSETTLNGSGGVRYFWVPNSSGGNNIISDSTISNPQVFPNSSTTFTVIAIGADGCPGVTTAEVIVIPDSNLVFYNTITPNGDGINDYWFVGNLDLYPNNTLTIFNRYGKQIFFAAPYTNNWNGTSEGSDVPDATYYYLLSTGKGKTYEGSITVIRKKQ